MSIRFQADADFNHVILRAVQRREPAVDFRSAPAADLAGLADPDVLAAAAQNRRLLVTHDARTMPYHFATFVADAQSTGVLIVPQRLPIARVADDLLLIWQATEADEWKNRIRFLPL
jgi:hypothetical protein